MIKPTIEKVRGKFIIEWSHVILGEGETKKEALTDAAKRTFEIRKQIQRLWAEEEKLGWEK